MGNVIIYPTGTTGNSDPHIVFDDDTAKLQFNVKSTGALSLSSATVSAGFEIMEIGQWGNFDYISKLWGTHSWPGYESLNHNNVITNEERNVCQCWILARKNM